MKKVATRFAPSPTGPLHIGGVRTALFNWLYSKNQKGDFYLRVDCTFTYYFSVSVDFHQFNMSHLISGDDHMLYFF